MEHTLAIKIEGVAIPLPTDLEMNVDLMNPFFETETNINFFNYPFTVPNSDELAVVLGYPSVVELSRLANTFQDFAGAELYIDNILFRRGTLTVSEATPDEVTLYFRDRLGELRDAVEDKTLRDLVFDEIDLTTYGADLVDAADDLLTQAVDSIKVIFAPAYHALLPGQLDGNGNEIFMLCLNNYDPVAGTFLVQHDASVSTQYHNCFVPFPFLRPVLKECFEEHGYTLSSDLFSNTDFNRLIIHNSRSLIKAAPVDNWPMLYEESIAVPDAVEELEVNIEKHLPGMKILEFLSEIKKLFNTAMVFHNVLPQAEMLHWATIVDNNETEDWTDIADPNVLIQEPEQPDVLRRYEEDSENGILENKVFPIGNSGEATPVDLVADLPSPTPEGLCCLVRSLNHYYKVVSVDSVLTWQFFSYNIQEYKDGSGEEEIVNQSALLPTDMYTNDWFPLYDNFPFKVTKLGYNDWTDGYKVLCGDFKLRLMFYRGLQDIDVTYQAPLATVDNYNSLGDQVGNWTLHWHGLGGLWDTHWYSFYEMVKYKPVIFNIRFDMVKLLNLSFKKFQIIRGQKYYIKRIRLHLPRIEESEVEFYKVPEPVEI